MDNIIVVIIGVVVLIFILALSSPNIFEALWEAILNAIGAFRGWLVIRMLALVLTFVSLYLIWLYVMNDGVPNFMGEIVLSVPTPRPTIQIQFIAETPPLNPIYLPLVQR